MQLMIDIAAESAASLRLAAQLLLDHAAILDGGVPAQNASVPAGTIPIAPLVPPSPPAPSNVLPFPPPPPPVAPAVVNPALSMGNGSTVPIAPPVPIATPNAATSAPVVPAPPAPTTAPNTASPATTTTGVIERDKAGMPWDARIHQKLKSKKKDGTWKLQKGIDPAIVTGVMQDLQARGLLTPAPVGAVAPVALPPVPPPPGIANGAAPGQETAQAQAYQAGQLPPPAPGQETSSVTLPPVPVPTAPVLGVPDAPNAGMVQGLDPFRALVQKFTNARVQGKLTQDQVNGIITQAGAPSLQALKAMAHLIPVADAMLDGELAMA